MHVNAYMLGQSFFWGTILKNWNVACKANIIMASAVDTCVYTCSKDVVNAKKLHFDFMLLVSSMLFLSVSMKSCIR